MSEIRAQVDKRIAELLLAEFESAYRRDEFGVIVQDVPSFDRKHLLASLPDVLASAKGRLRLALVGEHEGVAEFGAIHPSFADFVAADEETAVQWRNQKKKTIVVVADEPLSKQGSLKEFGTLGERSLINRLCDDQRDKAEVTWLRSLWDALKSSRGPNLSLQSIATFAANLQSLPALQRSVQASAQLYALGLFPDGHLADESTEARIIHRLKANAEMLNMVSNATPEDWDRMATYCRQLPAKEKVRFNGIRKRLKSISQRNADDLRDLTFADVQTLWKGKLAPSAAVEGGVTTSTEPGKIPVESAVAELLLEGNVEGLADLAERFEQLTDQVENEQTAGEDEPLIAPIGGEDGSGAGPQVITSVNADIIALVKSRSTTGEWGGVIDIESDRVDALTEVSAFKACLPFEFQDFKHQLQQFVEAELSPPVCLELADQLAATRASLLRHVAELTASPVTVLAGRPEVFTAAEEYLKTYDQLLRQLQAAYQEMYAQAGDEAETLVHWLLSMELYVYRREEVTEVLLSPLHPLNLWRSVAIVRDLQALGGKLSPTERETLVAASAENLQLLNVLVLPHISGLNEQASLLGHAGVIGHLPLFKEAPRGVLEPDGVKSVSAIAQLVAHLRPFARPGLQVMMVNAPRPARFLAAVLEALDLDDPTTEDTFWGVHFRFRYTSDDTRGWTAELEDLDDQVKDLIRMGQERGLISVSVDPEIKKWPEIIDDMRALPAHLTVVFDPFEVRTALVSRAGLHALSPWMPSCEYRYNKLKKQIMIVPVAEEEVFATYFSTATLVHRELKQSTVTHQPQVASVKNWLDQLAEQSIWTVIADPHRVLVPRLGDAEVIDRRVENARQITTFGRDLSPFVRRLDQQLRKTHFVADPATLEELIHDLVAMEPNGILGLVGGEKGAHVKGALGKLIAMRWYRRLEPSGLAVSLDTQNARRWLSAGGHSNEKADLIGIREHGGELIIDVIEVKTHDQSVPYSIQGDLVSGHAVDQVLATMHALAEVFGGANLTPLAKPRREVVREHLYTALLRDLDPQYIERWHALLQDLFNGSIKVRLSGRIIHVQLASVATTQPIVKMSWTGVPVQIDTLSATEVGLVLTTTKLVKEDLPLSGTEGHASEDESLDPASVFDLLSRASSSSQTTEDASLSQSLQSSLSSPESNVSNFAASAEVEGNEKVHDEEVTAPPPQMLNHPATLEIHLGEEINTKSSVSWAPKIGRAHV